MASPVAVFVPEVDDVEEPVLVPVPAPDDPELLGDAAEPDLAGVAAASGVAGECA
jgi:hypothetical protein